jgi:DNA polymerase III delta prime subunit
MKPIQDVKQLLKSAPELYHRLILLVGSTGTGKTDMLRVLARDLNVPLVNINLALSSQLLEFSAKQRALRLPEIFARVTDSKADPLLLDNLEILFDDHLKQDPLRLLQGISRNRTVVASWNGYATGQKLVYAEPGHAEHRNYEIGDVMIVQISGQSIVGAAGE